MRETWFAGGQSRTAAARSEPLGKAGLAALPLRMTPTGQAILEQLAIVDGLRRARSLDAAHSQRVTAIKSYQARRFERSYADLLVSQRYRAAARFFLEELYGPQEFGARDAQFIRIVPPLVRLFPDEIVATVATLARLHALSESLDDEMARYIEGSIVDAQAYVRSWQRTGRGADRQLQIDLTLDVGRALERYTRNPVLRGALRVMRRPAQSAGLGELQRFLEAGFDTFGAMRGADEFLTIVRDREQALCAALFADSAVTSVTEGSTDASTTMRAVLGQLP
jgi:hypothetical protein